MISGNLYSRAAHAPEVRAVRGETPSQWPFVDGFRSRRQAVCRRGSICKQPLSVITGNSTFQRPQILRLLSPEETAVGKGCGRDGSTAVEIERQSPEKGCGRHTFSDGRRGWSSIWWWPGSLCVPPESDAAEMERWL
ncbi:anthranilate phosphoribosyltransferase [Striga asiatica]|uniref:Anthranilate phosphoribosyltransferase n=1 Tax=Striga asiatica TaxID=4170 RepID=A0A5A7Q394_STRAF|nr:anthranilate phosphoribosyltransferase [Striga asiatica]